MKLKLHTLKISQYTVIALSIAENKERGKFTEEAIAKFEGKHLYSKVQCSFLNLYKNTAFKKL
jgi:hypothetical protein